VTAGASPFRPKRPTASVREGPFAATAPDRVVRDPFRSLRVISPNSFGFESLAIEFRVGCDFQRVNRRGIAERLEITGLNDSEFAVFVANRAGVGYWPKPGLWPSSSHLEVGTIWQTLLGMVPIDNWCDWGPCGFGATPGATISAYHPSVLECLTLAGIPVAVDLMGLSWVPNADPKDWQWSSDKTGFVFVGGAESDASMLGSVESTAGRIGETADFVKHTPHAQELLSQSFRNYGYKISVKQSQRKL